MTKYAIALAIAALSANAAADHVYHGIAQGNADLSTSHPSDRSVGARPMAATSFDIYRGLAVGNDDLFQSRQWVGAAGSRPNIYRGLSPSPDLAY